MKSKVIALSAVSASLTAICLIVGAFFEFADMFAVVLSSVFVIMPLYLNSYKGSFLCYLAGGVIAFLCSGFNILSLVFPAYFCFFGVYPIVKYKMREKAIDKRLVFVIGLIWFTIVAYGLYFYYTVIIGGMFTGLPEWVSKYALLGVSLISILFFVVYDRFIFVVRFFINKYLSRIIR